MTKRVIQVPLAWVFAGVLMTVGSPMLSIFASVNIADRNADRQLKAVAAAKVEATAETKRITCSFFGSSMDVYKETPPSTAAGRAQLANYVELYRFTGCQPPRTR